MAGAEGRPPVADVSRGGAAVVASLVVSSWEGGGFPSSPEVPMSQPGLQLIKAQDLLVLQRLSVCVCGT